MVIISVQGNLERWLMAICELLARVSLMTKQDGGGRQQDVKRWGLWLHLVGDMYMAACVPTSPALSPLNLSLTQLDGKEGKHAHMCCGGMSEGKGRGKQLGNEKK
jgi:hypothetical protein